MKIALEGKDGPWKYDWESGETAHVEPTDSESIPFDVHPLSPQLAGTEFEGILLKPEHLETNNLTVFEYGIGADYQQYAPMAQEMAKLGIPVALHRTPKMRNIEKPGIMDFLKAKRRRELVRSAAYLFKFVKNPYVHDSMAAGALTDAAQDHSPELEGTVDYGHSKGGLPLVMRANFDSRVKAVYADAISGAVDRVAILNHVESIVPLVGDVKTIMSELDEDDKPEMIRQFLEKKLLIGLQMLYLVGPRPNVTNGLISLAASDREVPVVYVSREKDTIFNDRDTQRAGQLWMESGLIAHHERVLDSTHHAPMDKPKESARLFRDLIHKVTTERSEQIAS